MNPGDAKILFADDETGFLETLVKRMAKRGINAHSVNSGENVLTYMEENDVDVLVLDMKMPGLSGRETLTRVKERWPDTQVILLTGHACVSAAMESMAQGAFDYLTKPVEIEGLIFRIEDACETIKLKPQNNSMKEKRLDQISQKGGTV